MRAAKIKHFLSFSDTAYGRAGETAAPEQEAKGRDRKWLLRRTNERDVAVAPEELDVGVDVVLGGNSVEDEIKAACMLLHLVRISGDDDFVGAEAERIFLLIG